MKTKGGVHISVTLFSTMVYPSYRRDFVHIPSSTLTHTGLRIAFFLFATTSDPLLPSMNEMFSSFHLGL